MSRLYSLEVASWTQGAERPKSNSRRGAEARAGPSGDLAGLSNSHLYRRRRTTNTGPVQVAIGERRKQHREGGPGFMRVDSVNRAELDGEKGLHLMNVVGEVTRYEFVGPVEIISEAFVLPVLERLIRVLPLPDYGLPRR